MSFLYAQALLEDHQRRVASVRAIRRAAPRRLRHPLRRRLACSAERVRAWWHLHVTPTPAPLLSATPAPSRRLTRD